MFYCCVRMCVTGKEEERQMFQQMQAMAQKQVEHALISSLCLSVCACVCFTKTNTIKQTTTHHP